MSSNASTTTSEGSSTSSNSSLSKPQPPSSRSLQQWLSRAPEKVKELVEKVFAGATGGLADSSQDDDFASAISTSGDGAWLLSDSKGSQGSKPKPKRRVFKIDLSTAEKKDLEVRFPGDDKDTIIAASRTSSVGDENKFNVNECDKDPTASRASIRPDPRSCDTHANRPARLEPPGWLKSLDTSSLSMAPHMEPGEEDNIAYLLREKLPKWNEFDTIERWMRPLQDVALKHDLSPTLESYYNLAHRMTLQGDMTPEQMADAAVEGNRGSLVGPGVTTLDPDTRKMVWGDFRDAFAQELLTPSDVPIMSNGCTTDQAARFPEANGTHYGTDSTTATTRRLAFGHLATEFRSRRPETSWQEAMRAGVWTVNESHLNTAMSANAAKERAMQKLESGDSDWTNRGPVNFTAATEQPHWDDVNGCRPSDLRTSLYPERMASYNENSTAPSSGSGETRWKRLLKGDSLSTQAKSLFSCF